ncbi:flavodoxin [Odoribacter laneus]|uniref:flavodoxin n=1 Tax=Odoribacter laneus TaxID=626933 RepID=UPI003AB771CA
MKKIYLTITAVFALMGFNLLFAHTAVGEQDKETLSGVETSAKAKSKILVTYFTWPEPDGVDASSGASRVISNGKLYGNTEYVGHIISNATGGDLFAIQTERTYPSPHKALIDAAKKEAEAKEYPKLKTHIGNLSEYDVVFVGYPNWWYDMPMALYTFFDEYDFSGKTVIPFVTHGGSRFSQSVETIREMEKQATVIQGPSVSARNVPDAEKSIKAWLQNQGLISDK